jgi:Salmonella virulence plasmid 65kDa B protein
MGKKFAANPLTSSTSMSVQIATTSGQSGFAPQLSLSHDSGSDNGILEWGEDLLLVQSE